MIRCPKGEKKAEIPLGSLGSGPNIDTGSLRVQPWAALIVAQVAFPEGALP